MELKIQEIRKQKNIKQKEMAKMLKISQPTYSNYENGKRTIPNETLCEIANILEKPIDKLLGRQWE